MIKKFFLHLHLINKHRFTVFRLSCKAGIPFRGLIHDLSKYSPTEFFEGVKYYQGTYSPIKNCKRENGYSKAWLHHKGRNKHHSEYWYDFTAPDETPVIPYKYTVEMICDNLAAGITYNGKSWNNSTQLNYYMNDRKNRRINEKIDKILIEVYTKIKNEGIDKVIRPKVLKEIYNRNVGE